MNDELGLDWYDYGARNYDAGLGRWMNIDPDGRDWIKHWDASVTDASHTPDNYIYIGAEDTSIVNDLFGDQTVYRTSTTDYGSVSHNDETTAHGYGVAANIVIADSEMQVSLRANVSVTRDSDTGEITSKVFNGIDVGVIVSGDTTSGVSEGMSMTLAPNEMKMNGSEMNNTSGDSGLSGAGKVSKGNSSTFNGFISAADIQSIDGSATYSFSFKGLYVDKGSKS